MQDKIVQEIMEAMEVFVRDRIAWAFAAGCKIGAQGVARGPALKPVIQMTLEGKVIREWESIAEADRSLGLCSGNITKCCKGRYKTSGGFKWKYSDV